MSHSPVTIPKDAKFIATRLISPSEHINALTQLGDLLSFLGKPRLFLAHPALKSLRHAQLRALLGHIDEVLQSFFRLPERLGR